MNNYKKKYAGTPAEGLERKNEAIGRFQDSKELSIRISSAQRDAVLIMTTRGLEGMSDEDIKKGIEFWRKWLFEISDSNKFLTENTKPF